VTCTVNGCERSDSRDLGGRLGLCGAHYDRLLRHGDVQAHIPVRPCDDIELPPPPDFPEDVDEVAVDRAVAGDPPEGMTSAERFYAAWLLSVRRLTAEQVAERIGCTPRTVQRYRATARRLIGDVSERVAS
jgi:DNA-binding CsgD family transcriptional regulator